MVSKKAESCESQIDATHAIQPDEHRRHQTEGHRWYWSHQACHHGRLRPGSSGEGEPKYKHLALKWSLRMASTTDNKSSVRSGPRKVGWMIGGLFDHDHSYSDQEALEARNVLRLWVDRHPDS